MDPKAIFFGTSDVVQAPSPAAAAATTTDEAAQSRAHQQILHDRLRGKRFLLCSGATDKLVAYERGEAFLTWFKDATGSRFRDEGISVDDRLYPGVGHTFSAEMIVDAVEFVKEVVASADQQQRQQQETRGGVTTPPTPSKI